ncbi:MAG: hypothetical protein IKM28_07085, partial [Lachnospiraceae bacterium]|nr:hypothetical protein [Lachnospiraceae bacterium]
AFLCDLVAIFWGQLSLYLFILQIFSVFIISYIFGTLNDGRLIGKVRGRKEDLVIIPLLLGCHLGGIMFVFCIDSINRQKFFIIFAVLVCIFVPMICWINKKWRSIRSNLADYQLIVKAEEKDFRRRGLSNADYH